MKKLYVVVRADLSVAQKAVQAGHALAEWLLNNEETTNWDNGTLVYLTATNSIKLRNLIHKLYDNNIKFSSFKEPDLDNEVTAIASLGSNKMFKRLPML